ncbi:MAG: hypothetical protein KAH13_00470, partial [Tenericutes bacterium]|nr:hypothetical protein [Mycoplasmatota bacterium]
ITFISSSNGAVESEALEARRIVEEEVCLFYQTKLSEYHIEPGDMQSIGKYMRNHNPSFTLQKDKLHQELTDCINERIKENNPLY